MNKLRVPLLTLVVITVLVFAGYLANRKVTADKLKAQKVAADKIAAMKLATEKLAAQKLAAENARRLAAAKAEVTHKIDPSKIGFEITFEVYNEFDNGVRFSAICDPLKSKGLPFLIGSKILSARIVEVHGRKEGNKHHIELSKAPNTMETTIETKKFGKIALYDGNTGDQEVQLNDAQISQIQESIAASRH